MLIYFPNFQQTWIFLTLKSSQYHITQNSIQWEQCTWMQTDEWMEARVKVLGTFCDYANVPKYIKKVKPSPTNAMKTYRDQKYSSIIHTFGTMLIRDKLHVLAALPPGEKPSTQWIVGWAGPEPVWADSVFIHIPWHTELMDTTGPTSHEILFKYSMLINVTSGKYNRLRPTHLVTIVKPC